MPRPLKPRHALAPGLALAVLLAAGGYALASAGAATTRRATKIPVGYANVCIDRHTAVMHQQRRCRRTQRKLLVSTNGPDRVVSSAIYGQPVGQPTTDVDLNLKHVGAGLYTAAPGDTALQLNVCAVSATPIDTNAANADTVTWSFTANDAQIQLAVHNASGALTDQVGFSVVIDCPIGLVGAYY